MNELPREENEVSLVRIKLLIDTPYVDVIIPAGTLGTMVDDDGDIYFGQAVVFDGFPDVYYVERGTLEVQQ